MKCPNKKCRRETDREVTKVDKQGKVTTGCHACLHRQAHPHLYSGKKIWTGQDAYGVERNAELNYEFEKQTMESAARTRRRMDYDTKLATVGID